MTIQLLNKIDSLQAILFDFDGVLCECMDVKTEAFAQLFEPFGEDVVKKVVEHHVKHGGISRYKKIEYYYKKYLNQEISNDDVNKIAQKFSDLVVEKVIASDYVRGAKEFLEKYYDKIDFYVISGTPQEELDLIVKKRNMEKYFKGVFGTPITKPVHIRRIISEKKYDPKKIVYVGDSFSDYKDAQEAKIPFLGRTCEGRGSYFSDDVHTIPDFLGLLD